MSENPTAHVDLGAVAHNLARVRAHLAPHVSVMAMVKADGYGHGIAAVARRLAAAGANWFGVATPGEALALRAAGVEKRALLLSPVREPAVVTELCDLDVAMVATDALSVDAYLAADLPRPLRLHLKVDTGMGRLGLPWGSSAEVATKIASDRRLELEGVWTHFTDADAEEDVATMLQLEAFELALAALARHGVEPPLRHTANSAATLAFPEAHYDLVRPGIVLYGHHPSRATVPLEPDLRPAMTLSAPVTFVKPVSAGTRVSYGRLWTAQRDTHLATVRLGYADGYPRLLTGLGWASLAGVRCEIAGRVCMDQLLLDVGPAVAAGVDVQVGDRAVFWGADGPETGAVAAAIGTVSYELITRLMPRVERVYSG